MATRTGKAAGMTAEQRDALIEAWNASEPHGAAALELDGAKAPFPLERRTFSSGSVGFYGQSKVTGSDGRRYQVAVTATLIGSKPQA